MTCRVEAGETYLQAYNAESRLALVKKIASGTCASPTTLSREWDFAYDGDGMRVSQLTTEYDGNGNPLTPVLTVYFMGGLYEETDGAARKYYSIAGMTVTMNDGSGMNCLLTDHHETSPCPPLFEGSALRDLGSTTVTTDGSGNAVSELRYEPCPCDPWRRDLRWPLEAAPRRGEVRYSDQVTPTDYAYTGQYSNVTDFGLLFYNARWYDPALGRFTQPDTIVPNAADPQSWDRYSYVVNDPIAMTDPSGNFGKCGDKSGYSCRITQDKVKSLEGKWEAEAKADAAAQSAGHASFCSFNPSACSSSGGGVAPTGTGFTLAVAGASWLDSATSAASDASTANSPANPYLPDAFGLGIGGIAGFFPAQGTGGVDALFVADENALHVFPYTGVAMSGAGGGFTGGPYAIVGWNIHEAGDYVGVSNVASLTVAYGHGATISYFWSGQAPLQAGAPQGVGLWYSPGLGASASYSNVTYGQPWLSIP